MREALLNGIDELLGPMTPETEALHVLVEEVTRPSIVRR